MRGAGDMKMFTVANFVNLFIRVFVAMAFAPIFGLQMVWIAVPIGWFSNWIISFWSIGQASGKGYIRDNCKLNKNII